LQKGEAAAQRSLRVELGRDGAGCDFACAIGHVVGHLKDIGKAGAGDRAACVGILLLLGDGAVRVEAEGVVLLVGRAGNSDGLSVDQGVEPDEHVRMALHGTRVVGDVGGVLVADDVQLERAGVAGVGLCSSVSVHLPHPVVCVWCFWCVRGETAFVQVGWFFGKCGSSYPSWPLAARVPLSSCCSSCKAFYVHKRQSKR
jgi:hypothetical protein